MVCCVAHGCTQRSGSTEGIRFHTFPHRDEVLLKKWMVAITPESFVPSTHFFMHFCPVTMATHAESVNSDLQTFTTHTTLNTKQNQLAIKVSADN